MIEFDVDMGYLLEYDELDCVVLNDENGEHEPMEFLPKAESGTCENISDPPSGFLCSKCGWGDFSEPSHLLTTAKFADNDKGPNYCPNCGAKVKNKPCQKPANERAAAESSESGLRGSRSDYPIMDGFSYDE